MKITIELTIYFHISYFNNRTIKITFFRLIFFKDITKILRFVFCLLRILYLYSEDFARCFSTKKDIDNFQHKKPFKYTVLLFVMAKTRMTSNNKSENKKRSLAKEKRRKKEKQLLHEIVRITTVKKINEKTT